jgi:regulator of protease activity HflC (stomatin/prohibitin superfamily)
MKHRSTGGIMNQEVQPCRQPEATPVGHAGTRVEIHERPAWAISGWFGVLVVAACIAAGVLISQGSDAAVAFAPITVGVVILTSLVIVQPGHTKVVRFFGSYVGTVRRSGLWWILPLADRRNLSIRVRNFETNHLKVNDADGNPVEIAAIVVWQGADTSRAVYAVDDYVNFVQVQAESALRHVATTHPYDDATGEGTSLRGSTDVVAAELAKEVAQRVVIAGVEIVEVRISHLAYSPEIAQAMLRRQQANAVVAARSRIVEGAVGMVELALAGLSERDIVELDEERKAAMVSNLLVVLCAEQPASPVVNTGTLYT